MTTTPYFFVISSLNHPVYRTIQKKRRALFEKYGVPYSILVNTNNTARNATYPPLLDDEILFPIGGYNPSMSLKFLYAVKLFFRSFSRWEDVPNFIVRINATVYLYFPELLRYMESLPREKVLAGPVIHANKTFVNGMLMIFSKDVLRNMLTDPGMFDQTLLSDNDDVALSQLAKPYCEFHSMMPHFVYGNTRENSSSKGVYDLEKIKPLDNEKWAFRIRHDESRRNADIENWDKLLVFFDGVPENSELFGDGGSGLTNQTFQSNKYSLWLYVMLCAVAVILIVAVTALIVKH